MDTRAPSRSISVIVCVAVLAAAGLVAISAAKADEAEKAKTIALGTQYELTTPASWLTRQPRSQIIDHELAVPKMGDDEQDGRVTVTAATGTVEANVNRWCDQFKQTDGSSTKDRAKVEKKQIAGKEVTIVDISGTYMDQPAPMAPGVERADYRMLAAIIPGKENGKYFIKFYGPKKTVGDNAEAFTKMLDSLKAK